MTPEQCRELAEFHEHMATWGAQQAHFCLAGTAQAAILAVAEQHRESARYWREKPVSKDGTRPKGWHDDFASERPEHARRQGATNPVDHECQQFEPGGPCMICGHPPAEHTAWPICHAYAPSGSPPETGPDTRQPEMVSRAKIIELIEVANSKLTTTHIHPPNDLLKASMILDWLADQVRKL